MELSDKVRRRREELGLTQEELALRMGYKSRVSINKIENGRPVSQKIIVRLAEALDVTVPYLMGWDERSEEELEDLGALAADMIMDPDAVEMVRQYMAMDQTDRQALRDYMALSDADRYAVRLVVASMSEKIKKTDANASAVEVEESFYKA